VDVELTSDQGDRQMLGAGYEIDGPATGPQV
jgi:hypothetical protein